MRTQLHDAHVEAYTHHIARRLQADLYITRWDETFFFPPSHIVKLKSDYWTQWWARFDP